eukprot:m.207561 g.207561  ORF g.207561 m.207561 type:complete len:74 (-) comp18930_c0_seq5:1098-1319(-)
MQTGPAMPSHQMNLKEMKMVSVYIIECVLSTTRFVWGNKHEAMRVDQLLAPTYTPLLVIWAKMCERGNQVCCS